MSLHNHLVAVDGILGQGAMNFIKSSQDESACCRLMVSAVKFRHFDIEQRGVHEHIASSVYTQC